MAFSKRPTFLKRQKEQQRLARAARKREERLARKRAKAEGLSVDDEFGTLEDLGLEAPEGARPLSPTPGGSASEEDSRS